jgi:uncharacterized protein DUF6166
MAERFYSGERDGTVTVRDQGGSRETRPLQCRFDYRKYVTGRAGKNPDHTRLALTLLGDALEDERRAVEAHEYFIKRVIPVLAPRFTISRSRILAYVNTMEMDKRAEALLARRGRTLAEK